MLLYIDLIIYITPIYWPLFQHNLGSWYQKGRTILDFIEERDNLVAVVASAGTYANHLHFAPDKQPHQHLITQIFMGQTLTLLILTVKCDIKLMTNLIHNHMHNCLRNNVTLCFVHNLQIRVDEITNCFHLSFQLWI